jgi:hypothetical protein
MSDMASPRSIRSSSNKKALHSSSAWIDNDNMSESLLGMYTQDEVDEDGSGNYQFSSADHSSDMPDNYLFSSSSQTSRLNDINYLNVAAYIANVTVASLFGAWGIDGYLPTLWRISQDYPVSKVSQPYDILNSMHGLIYNYLNSECLDKNCCTPH